MFERVDPGLIVRELLEGLGLSAGTVSWLSTLVMVLSVVIIAWLSQIFSKVIIMQVVTRVVKRSKSDVDDRFLETRMFQRLAWIVPGILVYYIASWLLKDSPGWLVFVHKITAIYIVLLATGAVTAFIEGWHLSLIHI